MSPALIVGVSVAGGAGALSRFLVDASVSARRPSSFPVGTLLINVAGSLVLGVLTGLVLFHDVDDAWRVVLGTGFAGGFTTFSTTSFTTVRLAQERLPTYAALNALGTLALSIAAAALGLLLAKA